MHPVIPYLEPKRKFMPDLISTLSSRLEKSDPSDPGPLQESCGDAVRAAESPRSAWQAIYRGLRGSCPRCDRARLFGSFLKPVPSCPACRQDWTHHRADDFPAYIAIFVAGHVMAPVLITMVKSGAFSPFWLLTIILTVTLVLLLALLQPAKGTVIALQWWFGMGGFTPGHENCRPD